MDLLSILVRWLHIVAGILWIGLLYYYNFVNVHFAATIEGETRRKVMLELIPRALYWFRWGAAYTWFTGIVLLMLVFYHGGLMFDAGTDAGWGIPAFVMLAVVFIIGFEVYETLAKSSLGQNLKLFGVVGFVLIALIVYLMIEYAGFSYRAYVIHTGAMFGTIMAANVWMKIWPAQKKVLAAVKAGEAPDPALIALAGTRSKHNTYLSVPLVWAMINAHTTVPAANSWLYLLGAVVVGWLTVSLAYRKAAKVKGF